MPKFGPIANHLNEGISKALEGVVTTLEENVERDGVAEEVKEVGGEELQNGSKDLLKSISDLETILHWVAHVKIALLIMLE